VRAGAEAQHDEDDLHPLEEDRLERDDEPESVAPRATRSRTGRIAQLGDRVSVDPVLVMKGLVPARPQDRLPEPGQPEHEQEPADHDAQGRDRHVVNERHADRPHEHREERDPGGAALDRRAPAARRPRGEDDRQRLDHLNRAGEEDGYGKRYLGR